MVLSMPIKKSPRQYLRVVVAVDVNDVHVHKGDSIQILCRRHYIIAHSIRVSCALFKQKRS